jgi:hypothetical protein
MNQFHEIIRKRKRFNGKPFSHWQAQADELVVDSILRAALQYTEQEQPSIIAHLAGQRLLEIAQAESPTLFEKVLATRARCLEGFTRIMQSISG